MTKLFESKELKNASWLIGGRIAQMAISFFVGVITARYLGPGNFGLIGYGSAYVAFFSAVSNLGLNSVIIKNFVDHPGEEGKTLGTVLVMRAVSGLLSMITLICFVLIIDRDDPLSIVVTSLCSCALVFQIFDSINYWFQYQYQSKTTSIAALFAYICVSAYRIILLILGKDVRWFAFATVIDHICVAIFLFISYKRHKGPRLSFSLARGKSMLQSSYHYILSAIMGSVYGQTDKLMLKQMLGQDEVGFYSLAVTICNLWVFVLSAVIDSIYPTILSLYNVDREKYKQKNRQLYCIVFYTSAAVSLGFLVLGQWIIKILYGSEYLPSAAPLKIVTWYTAFSYLGVARNAWIVCENKQRYLKYMYFCAAVLNVFLNYILIPVMGASGAALASLLTQISTSILLPALFKEMRPNVKLMLEAICFKNVFN